MTILEVASHADILLDRRAFLGHERPRTLLDEVLTTSVWEAILRPPYPNLICPS